MIIADTYVALTAVLIGPGGKIRDFLVNQRMPQVSAKYSDDAVSQLLRKSEGKSDELQMLMRTVELENSRKLVACPSTPTKSW